MLNFVSLLNSKYLVENEPIIKFLIQSKNKKGVNMLSNIYSGNNYYSDFDLHTDKLVDLSCSQHKTMIKKLSLVIQNYIRKILMEVLLIEKLPKSDLIII